MRINMFSGLRKRMRHAFERRVRRCVFEKPYVYGNADRLEVHPTAVLNNALVNTISGRVCIGEHVFFGHGVTLLTGTHDVHARRVSRMSAVSSEGRDIVIEPGVWVASNATIIGPCCIGHDAVVAAGAVVTHDVDPMQVVGGVPARVIHATMPTDDESESSLSLEVEGVGGSR